jgi:hypothetical protein
MWPSRFTRRGLSIERLFTLLVLGRVKGAPHKIGVKMTSSVWAQTKIVWEDEGREFHV